VNKRQRQSLQRLARSVDLNLVGPEDLTIRRYQAGRGYFFRDAEGNLIHDLETIARFKSLAVPPAYRNVRYAADPRAHLQAVGEDAAGRLQYRYHPDWERVREMLKARRLATLAKSLPAIRRRIGRVLAARSLDRSFVVATVIELVAVTAIRAGSEEYARENGTRGATTLLKSHVKVSEGRLVLNFKAKGGKQVIKEVAHPRLAAAVERLLAVPGRRLFQYRDEDGAVHYIRASDVNAYLREIAGRPISLKDFRTLVASIGALETLAGAEPATSQRARRSQVLAALRTVAEDLANTPAVARKSYVHGAVLSAFESGALTRFAEDMSHRRSPATRAEILARIIAKYAG
jgi:DNA topoisomerase-1